MSNEITVINAEKISELTGYSTSEIAIVKNTILKGSNDSELAYFLNVTKSVGLNPFNKEIWGYKDYKNNLIVLTGRDGFLKKAQESKLWNGMSSGAVYSNDEFELDIPSAIIKHKPNFKDRGSLMGAYAIVRPKDCDLPTVEWAEFNTYDKGKFIWKDFPEAMIKKVAEANALKKAFGITGLNSEYDFVENDKGIVQAITAESAVVNELDVLKGKITTELDHYEGDDKEEIKEMCIAKTKSGEFNEKFAEGVLKTIRGEE